MRKAALQFIVENEKEIVTSESFDQLNGSKPLVKEVMAAIADDRKRKRERGLKVAYMKYHTEVPAKLTVAFSEKFEME